MHAHMVQWENKWETLPHYNSCSSSLSHAYEQNKQTSTFICSRTIVYIKSNHAAGSFKYSHQYLSTSSKKQRAKVIFTNEKSNQMSGKSLKFNESLKSWMKAIHIHTVWSYRIRIKILKQQAYGIRSFDSSVSERHVFALFFFLSLLYRQIKYSIRAWNERLIFDDCAISAYGVLTTRTCDCVYVWRDVRRCLYAIPQHQKRERERQTEKNVQNAHESLLENFVLLDLQSECIP